MMHTSESSSAIGRFAVGFVFQQIEVADKIAVFVEVRDEFAAFFVRLKGFDFAFASKVQRIGVIAFGKKVLFFLEKGNFPLVEICLFRSSRPRASSIKSFRPSGTF